MATPISFTVGELRLEGSLNDSDTAEKLAERLPLTVSMSRWGDEYYGSIEPGLDAPEAADARDLMEVGEIAYWPVGDALCVFFGPTPASAGDEPRAASAVNPLGRLDGEVTALRSLPSTIRARVEAR
jgi:hypothetical protein